MSTADATFESVWTRSGMAEQPDLEHRQTIRGPVLSTTHGRHVPRLSVGDPSATGEPTEAQLILLGLLGEGGMGQVHLARQPLLDRDVAIKRVREDAPPSASTSLFREARTMGSLEHPNILPVHALGADDAGRPILVMKRVVGVDWAELITRDDHPSWSWWTGLTAEPLARNVEVLIHLCRAAHFAHGRGVLHLDLKPENAMLADDGGVYLLDWGIARKLDDAGKRGIAGTPAYMAPELVDPSRPLSVATDVYLLGACLHEVLTGRPPHAGQNLKQVMAAAYLARPPELEGKAAGLAAICLRALSAQPEDRYPSALELQRALTAWIQTRGSSELARLALVSADRVHRLVLAPDPDVIAVARAFAEARFGLERALEQWSENEPARVGLDGLLREMVAFEIRRENVDHAASLIVDLGGDVALQAQVDELNARVRARRVLEQDSDLSVARSQRSAFVGALAVVGFVVCVVVLGGAFGDPTELSTFGVVMVGLVFNVAIWLFAAIGRSWLFRNAVNRSITLSVIAMSATVLIARVVGHLEGITVPQMFTQDLMVLGASLAVASAFMRARGVALAALVLVAAGVLSAVQPQLALAIFGWGTTLGFAAGALYWYRLGRADPI